MSNRLVLLKYSAHLSSINFNKFVTKITLKRSMFDSQHGTISRKTATENLHLFPESEEKARLVTG